MTKVNQNYLKLPGSYLFSEVARRISVYSAAHPEAKIIKLSIGDVTRPLAPAVIEAMHQAVTEMGTFEGFHGYGPEQGYDFLREAIAQHDYAARGVDMKPEEIFVSDGAKSDCGNIGDIFGVDNVVAVCDPVYPVYVDTNAMAGRAGEYQAELGRWSKLVYMPCVEENGFTPQPPKEKVDIIYLCFPNNPTGAVATKEQLKVWVDYANENGAVILYDSAYEAFITEDNIPHTIYEVEGARTCAIEFRSYSKTAGFTGNRCAYTVVPMELERDGAKLNALWNRRQCTKFNGVPYVVQRGAAAIYTPEGKAQTRETIAYYQNNAKVIREELTAAGLTCFGGVNAPYIWLKTPNGMGSWEFFDLLLDQANVAHPRRGLRPQRRGVHPPHRLRRRGGHPPGRGAHQDFPVTEQHACPAAGTAGGWNFSVSVRNSQEFFGKITSSPWENLQTKNALLWYDWIIQARRFAVLGGLFYETYGYFGPVRRVLHRIWRVSGVRPRRPLPHGPGKIPAHPGGHHPRRGLVLVPRPPGGHPPGPVATEPNLRPLHLAAGPGKLRSAAVGRKWTGDSLYSCFPDTPRQEWGGRHRSGAL